MIRQWLRELGERNWDIERRRIRPKHVLSDCISRLQYYLEICFAFVSDVLQWDIAKVFIVRIYDNAKNWANLMHSRSDIDGRRSLKV